MANSGIQVIKEIGSGAKTLAGSVSNTLKRKTAHGEKQIGVVFSNVSEYAAPVILQSISESFQPQGYVVKVRDAMNSQSREERILKEMIARKVDGLIIEPSKSQMLCKHMDLYRQLQKRGIPFVFIRSSYPQMMEHPKLLIDDNRGTYLLTRHLIATGRRRIVGLFKADDAVGYERHRGYVTAIQEAGFSYNPELVIWFHSEERFKRPTMALAQLLKKYPDCSAVVCYNDNMALAVIRFLESLGYKVPADIAVTGYGNYAMCAPEEHRLTTVEMPYEMIGRSAASMLLLMLTKGEGPENVSDIVLEPELVIRRSSTR